MDSSALSLGAKRARAWWQAQYKRPLFAVVCAFVLYAALASLATFPFVIHPHSTITAPYGGDLDGSIAKYQALVFEHQSPFFTTHFYGISWPVGPQDNVGVDRISLFSTLYLWLGSVLLGAVTAHSLLSFLGYVLTAFVMFLFVRRITGSALAGAVAGLAYGFCPIMYITAGSDMTYTQMWLDILPIWAFWELLTQGTTKKRMAIAIASVVPAIFWTPYFTLHVLVVGASCLTVALVYIWRSNGFKSAVAFCGITLVVWLAIMGVWRYVGLHSPSSIIPQRTITQIYQQSANPLMYLLPGDFSWGPHGNELLVHLVPRAVGTDLYLGLSVIVLGGVALLVLYRDRHKRSAGSDHPLRVAAVLASVTGLVCFFFSLPPEYKFGHLKIPMPGYIVAHAVPELRAGQRFVMPILGCAAILAGLGAWTLIRKIKPSWRLAATVVMLIVVGFDIWSIPPDWTSQVPNYPSLGVLRQLPSAPVAWYDRGSLLNNIAAMPCIQQRVYDKPLINDCALGRSPQLGVILTLPLCSQISALQAIGTKYLVVEPTDTATLQCLSRDGALERIAARDSTYDVVVMKSLSSGERAALSRRFDLPS